MSIICRFFGGLSVLSAALVAVVYGIKGAAAGSATSGRESVRSGALAGLEVLPVVVGLVLVAAVFLALGKYLRSHDARPRRR